MTKGKGYLLPSGDATEHELECCMVFYPARDEYRRALMGSLDYLATWIAWERDSQKRGQDAAASWKLANIQTWECCSMGYCDDLLTTLQELLEVTKLKETCCGDQDLTDGRQYTDEVVDGVGDVPQNIIDAGYAIDESDWAGFADYKCMISHLAVDHVESFLREIAPHISETGTVIGGIGVVGALIGAILTVAGLPISAGIIIALGAAAAIWTWITREGGDAVEDLADEIASNHFDLACAIYQGDGVSDSIADFNDKVDALFTPLDAIAIKAINLGPQLRAMYDGRYDQEDIAQSLADKGYDVYSYSCFCEEELEENQLLHNPELDAGAGWYVDTPFVQAANQVNITGEYTLYDKFISVFSVVMASGMTKLNLKTNAFSNASRENVWYFKTYRASDHVLVHTDNQVCNGHDGLFHWKTHGKFTATPGEKYYVKVAIHSNYSNAYAITDIELWESVS